MERVRCFFRKQSRNSNRLSITGKQQKQEQGKAAVEAAIVLPFIFVLVAGVVDIGSALNQYLNVTQAAREAVRFLGQVDDVQVGTLVLPGNGSDVELHRNKVAALSRALEVLEIETTAKDLTITGLQAEYDDETGAVRATIRAAFHGIFFNVKYPIQVSHVGRYLKNGKVYATSQTDSCGYLESFRQISLLEADGAIRGELDPVVTTVCAS